MERRSSSAIPAIHQKTVSIQSSSASTAAKPIEHARSPYIIFSVEKFGALKQANPGVRIPDIGRMIGQLWRLLPDDEKEGYRARFREEKAVCDAANRERLARMTETEKSQLRDALRERRHQKKLRRRRKLKKELGKPRPEDVNPFIIFMKSKTVERGDAPLALYMKGLAERWKMMPEEDKEEFVKNARENSALYRQRLLEWEKKAVAEGHPELVRRVNVRKASTTPRVSAVRPRVKPALKAAGPRPSAAKSKTVKDAATQTGALAAGKATAPKKTAARKKNPTVEE